MGARGRPTAPKPARTLHNGRPEGSYSPCGPCLTTPARRARTTRSTDDTSCQCGAVGRAKAGGNLRETARLTVPPAAVPLVARASARQSNRPLAPPACSPRQPCACLPACLQLNMPVSAPPSHPSAHCRHRSPARRRTACPLARRNPHASPRAWLSDRRPQTAARLAPPPQPTSAQSAAPCDDKLRELRRCSSPSCGCDWGSTAVSLCGQRWRGRPEFRRRRLSKIWSRIAANARLQIPTRPSFSNLAAAWLKGPETIQPSSARSALSLDLPFY